MKIFFVKVRGSDRTIKIEAGDYIIKEGILLFRVSAANTLVASFVNWESVIKEGSEK